MRYSRIPAIFNGKNYLKVPGKWKLLHGEFESTWTSREISNNKVENGRTIPWDFLLTKHFSCTFFTKNVLRIIWNWFGNGSQNQLNVFLGIFLFNACNAFNVISRCTFHCFRCFYCHKSQASLVWLPNGVFMYFHVFLWLFYGFLLCGYPLRKSMQNENKDIYLILLLENFL